MASLPSIAAIGSAAAGSIPSTMSVQILKLHCGVTVPTHPIQKLELSDPFLNNSEVHSNALEFLTPLDLHFQNGVRTNPLFQRSGICG